MLFSILEFLVSVLVMGRVGMVVLWVLSVVMIELMIWVERKGWVVLWMSMWLVFFRVVRLFVIELCLVILFVMIVVLFNVV